MHVKRMTKHVAMGALFRLVHLTGRRLHDGGITILSYHSIDDSGTGISVPPRLFAAHMETLAAEGCVAFTMSEVARYLAEQRPFPPRAVAITFDDGFANVGTVAAPILARYGLPATTYVITGMVGRALAWTQRGVPLPALPLLAWPQIAELQAAGHEIGAHTVTHGFLTHSSPAELQRELGESRAVLEQMLQTPVLSFAYPQGDYNAAVLAATRAAGYTSATTIDQGRAGHRHDPFRLPRLHVGGNTTPAILRAYTVPTAGPTYRLINAAIHVLLGRKTWPRPHPEEIQSTRTRPLPDTL